MSEHWSNSEAAVRRYQDIESTLDVQRPLAFLIATTRNFNLEAFCHSLSESLRGSRMIGSTQGCLLHLYLASMGSVPTELPPKSRGLMSYTALHFHEQEAHNIGATRKRQVELAELACRQLDNPILLVLDDDLTFEALTLKDGLPFKTYPYSYIHEVLLFAQNHPCDVALGGVTGAPPLPATSCMRTFLQDFFGTQSTSKNTSSRWADADYYYDLSETRTCWQSWPLLSSKGDQRNVHVALNQMFHSGPNSRPLVFLGNEGKPQPRIVRGGNTVVFNPNYLLNIQHPDLPRRGDSLWAILAAECGATILEFPYPLYHARNDESNIPWTGGSSFQGFLKKRMCDDVLGASMQRAMVGGIDLLPIYRGRLERQLHLVEDCLELIQKAKRFIDDGSESQGFWAMSLDERISFCNKAIDTLDSLRGHLTETILQAEPTSEKSTLMMNAMRSVARQAMEEGQ